MVHSSRGRSASSKQNNTSSVRLAGILREGDLILEFYSGNDAEADSGILLTPKRSALDDQGQLIQSSFFAPDDVPTLCTLLESSTALMHQWQLPEGLEKPNGASLESGAPLLS
ncbi:hypothetical protein [Thalassoglobus sp.]|uniref:hypothetical protein n=1 Tax=Thalassoglobus sp. TaxID=2795869 RepID=UPI003AA7FEE8